MKLEDLKSIKLNEMDDDGDYAYDNAQEDRYEQQHQDISDYAEKVIATAKKNPSEVKKAVNIGSTQLDLYMREIAKQLKVPTKLINKVATKAADKIGI